MAQTHAEISARYRASHKDEIAAYRLANGDRRRAYSNDWYTKNGGYVASKNVRLKLAALDAYGGPRCACCGETLIGGLSIDHINGDGAKHRKEAGVGKKGGSGFYQWLKNNGYPAGYQVLCMTCNKAKGTGDHCPHQDVWL